MQVPVCGLGFHACFAAVRGYLLLTYTLRVSYEEDGVAGCYFEASRAFRISACARLALKPVAALFERIAACWFGYDGK